MTTTCTHDEDTLISCEAECGTEICEECEEVNNQDGTILCDNCYADVIECVDCGEWTYGDIGWADGSEGDRCDDCQEKHEEEQQEVEQEKEQLEASIDRLYAEGLIDREETDDYGDTMEDHIRENFRTGGKASRALAEAQNSYELNSLLEAISVAHFRHNDTKYDEVSKSGMSEEQVAEVRKMANRGDL